MAERTVAFRLGERRMTLRGAHDPYLEPIAEKDFSGDPLARLAEALPPEPTILDIGANIGLTTLILAAIRPRARIAAFEPVADNARLLEENLRANGIANVSLVRAAAGDEEGRVPMIEDGPWSLVGAGPSVPLIALDAWCARTRPGVRIDFLKIDVEGYEPNVLAGARDLVRRWRPVIFLEFNSWTLLLQGHNPLAFAAFLWEAFEVSGAGGEGFPDAREFVFGNLRERGCVDDLVLRPRAAQEVPQGWFAKMRLPGGTGGPGAAFSWHGSSGARGFPEKLRRALRLVRRRGSSGPERAERHENARALRVSDAKSASRPAQGSPMVAPGAVPGYRCGLIFCDRTGICAT